MSQSIDPGDLSYPEKPDANGYAKKYYKRRAFYFGPHNSPESFLLFGEWKRRLVETGVAPEVRAIRKDLAQQSTPSPHLALGGPIERKPGQLALVSGVASVILIGAVLASAKIISSSMGPTVDGITLTNEEIDLIRGMRLHQEDLSRTHPTRGERIADLTMRLMEEGPIRGEDYLSNRGL